MFSIEGIQGMNDWKAWEPLHPTENGAESEIDGENIKRSWNLKKYSYSKKFKLMVRTLKELKFKEIPICGETFEEFEI